MILTLLLNRLDDNEAVESHAHTIGKKCIYIVGLPKKQLT